MYLKALSWAAGIIVTLFLVLFFRTFTPKKLMALWQKSVKTGSEKYRFIKKIRDFMNRGLTQFYYENGKVIIWAKNQPQADHKYKKILIKRRYADARSKNQLKKRQQANAARKKRKAMESHLARMKSGQETFKF